MGITASQIRQDLNCFGGFGQQDTDTMETLYNEIGKILGVERRFQRLLSVQEIWVMRLQTTNFKNVVLT